ncbi:histidine protein kinase DivJ [bacterium BMS3Abin03]|nr:histidine protein kinase DivJ [bacterium BMS3Abin03]
MFKFKLKHKFGNLSIKNKITILVSLIFFAAFIINVLYFPAHEEKQITEFIQNKAQNTMKILSSTVSLALGEQNYEYANELFSILRNDSSIVYIGLLDESGSVISIASSQNVKLPTLKAFNSNTFFEENNIIHTSRKIHMDEGIDVYLVTGFSVAERDLKISKVWQLALWLDIVILILAILFYFYLNRLITKPLIKFVKTIKHVAQTNDYRYVMEVKNSDEIGMLTEAFNILNSKVYSQTEKLRLQANFVQQNPAPVFRAKYDGTIIRANPAAESIFNEDLSGKSIYSLFTNIENPVVNSISITKHFQFVEQIEDKHFLFTAKRDEETESLYFYGSDVSEQIRYETELKKHQLHLEQLVEERTVELRESEEKFRNLADNSPNMIFIVQNEKVVYANKLCEEITGYSKEEFYSKDFEFKVLIEPEYWSSIIENFEKHIEGKEVQPLDYAIRTKTGGRIESILNTKLINYGGKVAILGIVTDITERKQAEEALKESEEYLRELNATKDKFFSIISHDLRAPFQALLSISDFFVNDIDNMTKQEIIDFASDLNQSAESLYELLNNLLDWSRIQTGKMKYEPRNVHLKRAIDKVIRLLTANAHNKRISITTKITNDLIVYTDRNMLHSLVQNLISNAIKFTNEGGEVKVMTHIKNNIVEIVVADNGVGMDENTVGKLFRIDTQVTSLGTKNEKGTGLGLILCKELVEKCGGKIWVESEPGKGTAFHFTLNKLNGTHSVGKLQDKLTDLV